MWTSANAAEKPNVPIPGHCVPKFVLSLSCTINRLFIPRFMDGAVFAFSDPVLYLATDC